MNFIPCNIISYYDVYKHETQYIDPLAIKGNNQQSETEDIMDQHAKGGFEPEKRKSASWRETAETQLREWEKKEEEGKKIPSISPSL